MEWFDSEERNIVKESARKFAKKEITDGIIDLERTTKPEFPRGVTAAGFASGYLAGSVPTELDGFGLDRVGRTMILYEIARAAAGPAVIFAVHEAALAPIIRSKDTADRSEWISRIVSCEADGDTPLTGLAFPELAVSDGSSESYIWLLGAEASERTVLLQPTAKGSARIAWAKTSELAAHSRESHPGSGIEEFAACRLDTPASGLNSTELLSGDAAHAEIEASLRILKFNLAVILVANAEAAFEQARAYAGERIQTGRPIIDHQEVRRCLTAMKTKIEAAKSFVFRVAANSDAAGGESRVELAESVFSFCAQIAEEVCLDSIQTLGGYGYMKDYGLEKRLRDTKTIQNLTGTYHTDCLALQ